MENLAKIKSELPHGYSKVLKQKMKEKHGAEMSVASIRRGLMEKHLNEKILECAVEFIDELAKRKAKMLKRMQNI